MKTITGVAQGSDAWHIHRARHFNASDCPAMLGVSPYKTRTKLLTELATGIAPEVNAATERRFADGHKFEELARPVAEQIVGEDLYPVVGTEGKLSASFDGLTMDGSICFEHKTLNASLRSITSASELPEQYRAQMEQQLMVSGASKCLFMASTWGANDEEIESMHVWYESDQAMRDRILQGWAQFAIDLENYSPVVVIERPKADVIIELPALFVHAKGEITTHNMKEFGEALQAKLEEVRSIALITDLDFSNAKAAAKMFRDKAKEIKVSKDSMLSQTVTIGEAARMMDAWSKDLNETALQLEKDVEKEDLAKKRLMVSEAGLAYSAHIEALEVETRPIQLNVRRPDFATAIKGKRNYTSMQSAVDDALANGKIDADASAHDVRLKLEWCKENAAGQHALFPDLQTIINKHFDDFTLLITSRIDTHKAAEAAKLEVERARIQAEEEAKARVKIEAETKTKADAEAKVKAELAEQQRKEEAAKHVTQSEPVAAIDASAKPVENIVQIKQIASAQPSRIQMIEAVSTTFKLTYSAAEQCMREAFAEIAA
jgi:putative phage-type endonuclease